MLSWEKSQLIVETTEREERAKSIEKIEEFVRQFHPITSQLNE